MRIHTDRLNPSDLWSAALTARVDLKMTMHGSRSRARAFNVTLRGDSNRKPNYGTSRNVDRFNTEDRAATWDQWGVFLSILFVTDTGRTFEPSLPMFIAATGEDHAGFNHRTHERFVPIKHYLTPGGAYTLDYWPEDAHGDHSWKSGDQPRMRVCRRCTAVEDYSETPSEMIAAFREPVAALPDPCQA